MLKSILNSTIREIIKKFKSTVDNIETNITAMDRKIKDNTLLIIELRRDLDTVKNELKVLTSRTNTILPSGLQNLSQSQWDEYVDDDLCKRKHKKHQHKC